MNKDTANPFNILSNLKFSESETDSLKDIENEENELFEQRKTQKIRVWLEKKKRNGKPVSVITGFNEYIEDMKSLAKLLKTKLGVGGSNTADEIIIQGQNRDKIIDILLSKGFKDIKKAGG